MHECVYVQLILILLPKKVRDGQYVTEKTKVE